MRTARLRGLSEDGQSLIVETGDGEPIAILADAQLREALRDVRPRPQLETEMESGMTPREIQMRIRAGASVEELVEATGMSVSRVEAFAAPVMAERNHVAGQAQIGSVRRVGESAAHRTLRTVLAERLREQASDPDAVTWDSCKLEDARWSVSAHYRVGEEDREALFTYDNRGRFSVAGNDEARWVIGEATGSATDPAVAGSDGDTEPTVKLHGDADELALIRAVETDDVDVSQREVAPPAGGDAHPDPVASGSGGTPGRPSVTLVESDTDTDASSDQVAETSTDEPEQADDARVAEAPTETESDLEDTPAAARAGSSPEVETESQLDLLYDLLGGDGYAEESTHVYEGLSDAAAVPDVTDGGWPTAPDETTDEEPTSTDEEPASTEVDEPAQDALPYADFVEPEPKPTARTEDTEQQPASDTPAATSETVGDADTATDSAPAAIEEPPGTDPAPTDVDEPSATESEAGEPTATQPEAPPADKPASKSKKRKRAAVPSWDEIMFGSPKSK